MDKMDEKAALDMILNEDSDDSDSDKPTNRMTMEKELFGNLEVRRAETKPMRYFDEEFKTLKEMSEKKDENTEIINLSENITVMPIKGSTDMLGVNQNYGGIGDKSKEVNSNSSNLSGKYSINSALTKFALSKYEASNQSKMLNGIINSDSDNSDENDNRASLFQSFRGAGVGNEDDDAKEVIDGLSDSSDEEFQKLTESAGLRGKSSLDQIKFLQKRETMFKNALDKMRLLEIIQYNEKQEYKGVVELEKQFVIFGKNK